MGRKELSSFFLGVLLSFSLTFFVLREQTEVSVERCNIVCHLHRVLRDSLSKQLNSLKQEYGKLNCEFNLKVQKQIHKVTDTGGWCRVDSAPNSTSHMTDIPFANALCKFFKGKRVASFGDGPGLYKKYLDKNAFLLAYDAYDGAPYCEEVTNGVVKFLDLTAPQYGLPVYDWIMSLEVAEHIPAKFEKIYMDNIVRHAKDGVLLSWAVPGQGGHSHVNGKSFSDVRKLMESFGFEYDEQPSKELKNSATFPWLRSNVNVFRRTHKTYLPTMA